MFQGVLGELQREHPGLWLEIQQTQQLADQLDKVAVQLLGTAEKVTRRSKRRSGKHEDRRFTRRASKKGLRNLIESTEHVQMVMQDVLDTAPESAGEYLQDALDSLNGAVARLQQAYGNLVTLDD